jgi:hypothetical protein
VVDDIEQRREAAIVVVATLVGRAHEQAFLAHEQSVEAHRLVDVIGRAIGLERAAIPTVPQKVRPRSPATCK